MNNNQQNIECNSKFSAGNIKELAKEIINNYLYLAESYFSKDHQLSDFEEKESLNILKEEIEKLL